MASRELRVSIVGDSRDLERALGRAGDSATGFGSKMSKMGKVVGLAALGAGAAITAGFVYTLKRGFDELADSQKVMAQTNAVIKSTGATANVTAKQVDDFANTLSKMSGVDDEVIGAGENMLLTFTNVRNEVGKGNDIFNRATSTLLDMSTALGTDMNKSAIQLGKALNDPIKGITALTRVGVTFDEGQRASIKSMVEAGNTMGAQKLILAELNKEFGGSAKAFGETMPGQLAKLKNSFDEVAGNLATKFLPILTSLLAWVNDNWPTIEKVINAAGVGIMATFNAIGVAVTYLRGQWEIHRATAIATWKSIQDAVMKTIAWFQANVVPAIQNVISAAIAIWNTFGSQIKQILATVVTVVKAFLQNMLAPFKIFFALLRGDWSAAWNELKATVSRTLGAIVAVLRTALSLLGQAAVAIGKAIVSGIVAGLSALGGKVYGELSKLFGLIISVAGIVYGFGKAIGTQLVDGIRDGVLSLIGGLKKTIENALGFLKNLNPFSTVAEGGAKYIGIPLMEGAARGIDGYGHLMGEATVRAITKAALTARAAASDAFAKLAQAALAAFDKVTADWTPPSLKLLEKMRLQDEIKSVKDAVTNAQAELDKLLAESAAASQARQALGTSAPPGMDPAEWQKQVDAAEAVIATNGPQILAAQGAVDAALRAQQEFNLGQKAIKEQKAHDESRARQRQHFANDLADLREWAITHQGQHEELQARLKELYKKYFGKAKEWGNRIGANIADGLREQIGEVEAAAAELGRAVERGFVRGQQQGRENAGGGGQGGKAPTGGKAPKGMNFAGGGPAPAGGNGGGGGGGDIRIPVYLDSKLLTEVIVKRQFALARYGHAVPGTS